MPAHPVIVAVANPYIAKFLIQSLHYWPCNSPFSVSSFTGVAFPFPFSLLPISHSLFRFHIPFPFSVFRSWLGLAGVGWSWLKLTEVGRSWLTLGTMDVLHTGLWSARHCTFGTTTNWGNRHIILFLNWEALYLLRQGRCWVWMIGWIFDDALNN